MIAIKRYITVLDLCNFLKTNFDLEQDGDYWRIFGVIQVGTFENKDVMFYEFRGETMKSFVAGLHGYETDPIESALIDIAGENESDVVFVGISNGKLETNDEELCPEIKPNKAEEDVPLVSSEVLIPRGTIQPKSLNIPSFLQASDDGTSFKDRIDANINEQ